MSETPDVPPAVDPLVMSDVLGHFASGVTVVAVPTGELRTKPRALNAALPFADGAFTVIFDAEDRPEPDQLRRALAAFDLSVVDGGVDGAGWLTRLSSRLSIWWDTWVIDGAVRLSSWSIKMLSWPACMLQSGRLQGYAFSILVGVLAFFGYYLTR